MDRELLVAHSGGKLLPERVLFLETKEHPQISNASSIEFSPTNRSTMPPKPPKNEVEEDDEEDEEENQQIPDHLIRILDGLAQEVLNSVFLRQGHHMTLSNNTSVDRLCTLSRAEWNERCNDFTFHLVRVALL